MGTCDDDTLRGHRAPCDRPRPRTCHLDTRSDDDTEKKVASASVATALARYDLPVPGGGGRGAVATRACVDKVEGRLEEPRRTRPHPSPGGPYSRMPFHGLRLPTKS